MPVFLNKINYNSSLHKISQYNHFFLLSYGFTNVEVGEQICLLEISLKAIRFLSNIFQKKEI
jgi:hypothetical protein